MESRGDVLRQTQITSTQGNRDTVEETSTNHDFEAITCVFQCIQ